MLLGGDRFSQVWSKAIFYFWGDPSLTMIVD